MAERTRGLWSLLERPWVYEGLQTLLGSDRGKRRFVAEDLKPLPGARVLDIGCGTARLARYLGPVSYVGYEPNAAYVEQGRQENAGRDVTLHAGLFDEAAVAELQRSGAAPFDLVIVGAVLHHMDDGQARELFRLLARVTHSAGRVVCLDNAFVAGQNPLAWALISLDRGQHVRKPEGYAELPVGHFAEISGRVLHTAWVPYTFWIMECRRPQVAQPG